MGFTVIDLESWPRRELYHLYREMDHPYFGVTVEIDATDWQRAIKAAGLPFYPALVHHVTAAANAIEAFRLRMRGDAVVLHDRLDVSFTVPWRTELFNFCTAPFDKDLETFLAATLPAIEAAESADRLLLEGAERDDMVYLSCSPWMSFTGLTQVGDARSGDAIPRIAWGKLVPRDGRQWLPLNVQLHHAVADGLHAARFIQRLEAVLADTATGLTVTGHHQE